MSREVEQADGKKPYVPPAAGCSQPAARGGGSGALQDVWRKRSESNCRSVRHSSGWLSQHRILRFVVERGTGAQ